MIIEHIMPTRLIIQLILLAVFEMTFKVAEQVRRTRRLAFSKHWISSWDIGLRSVTHSLSLLYNLVLLYKFVNLTLFGVDSYLEWIYSRQPQCYDHARMIWRPHSWRCAISFLVANHIGIHNRYEVQIWSSDLQSLCEVKVVSYTLLMSKQPFTKPS